MKDLFKVSGPAPKTPKAITPSLYRVTSFVYEKMMKANYVMCDVTELKGMKLLLVAFGSGAMDSFFLLLCLSAVFHKIT
jgi:hypothetical protein